MNESSFEIVIDVLAREIDSLRYQLKLEGEHHEKLLKQAKAAGDEVEMMRDRMDVLMAENAKLHAMVEEGCEKHG